MTTKNKKLSEAARVGRKMEVWMFIERLSKKVNRVSTVKILKYTAEQEVLLGEIITDESCDSTNV